MRNCFKRKVLTVTMNNVNILAAALGLTIATLGFHFYGKSELPQGMDDMEYMMFSALTLGVFGLIITFTTVGGAYWLNHGSTRFKIAFCGTLAVTAYAIITIRSLLPVVENIMNEDMMREYKEYYRNRRAKDIVDSCQREHECCGYFGLDDFPKHKTIPDSCCSLHNLKDYGRCTRRTAFPDPCRYKLGDIIDVYFNSMDVACFVTSSILIALILTVQAVVFVKDEDSKARMSKFQ